MNELDFLLSTTQAYVANASDIFNLFLTVVFGSFAFAAALPLRNIGRLFTVGPFQFSTSSLVIGFVFLSFYSISFLMFHASFNHASTLLTKMKAIVETMPNLSDISHVFIAQEAVIGKLDLTSVGFLIGSIGGWIIFMWVTNVNRG